MTVDELEQTLWARLHHERIAIFHVRARLQGTRHPVVLLHPAHRVGHTADVLEIYGAEIYWDTRVPVDNLYWLRPELARQLKNPVPQSSDE